MSYSPHAPAIKPAGDFMFEARQRRNVTRTELAARTGVGVTTIYSYETGKTEPRLTELFKLVAGLGCSIDEYVGFDYLMKFENDEVEIPPDREDDETYWIIRTDSAGRDYTVCPVCNRTVLDRDKLGWRRLLDLRETHYCPLCGVRLYKEKKDAPDTKP